MEDEKMNEKEQVKPRKRLNTGTIIVAIGIVVIAIIAVLVFTRPAGQVPIVEQNKTPVMVDNTPTVIEEVKPVITSSDSCGNGICDVTENYSNCQKDCIDTCGTGIITAGDGKNWRNCRQDLMSKCGNGVCESWEHYRYCPEDCEECIVDDMGTYTGPNKCPPSDRWVS
jgi:hypothetical protein